MNLVKKKLKNLKRLGFKSEELCEIEKLYKGEFFNPNDKGYRKLVLLSYLLCHKYNLVALNLGKNPSIFKRIKGYIKKRKILNRLFPIKHGLSEVGDNIKIIIGQVDFLGKGFINRDVHFSKYALVTCKNYTIFGVKINVGNSDVIKSGEEIKLGKIIIENDVWICGGVKIDNNIEIGKNSVVGAGANVKDNLKENCLCLGRPCKEKQEIIKGYKSKKENVFIRSENEINNIITHAKLNGFKGKFKEFKKLLKGEPFNSININLGLMYLYTHRLCAEFNSEKTSIERKNEILDILFYKHGKNLSVGSDLFVDLLGTVEIGDNVKIGNGVYFGGNIKIGNNVTILDNSLLFASGHSLYSKQRHVTFSFKKGLYNYTIAESIKVEDNVSLGKNVVIVSGTVVKQKIEDDKLVIKNKVI